MSVFSFILLNNIAPIFFIIILGYFMEKRFELDVWSFSKANFYIFVPALVFVKVYETELELEFLRALIFGIVFVFLLNLVANLIARIKDYEISKLNAFKNSIMFYNSGNFGLPLVILVFDGLPEAVSIQIMILMVQNLTTNTIGFYNAGRGQMNYKDSIKKIMMMPAVYAGGIALLMKFVPFELQDFFLWPSIEYMAEGLIPVALLTLGIQISIATLDLKDFDVYLASLMRLIGGPLLALVLMQFLGIEGLMAQVLFISSAVPSAVNTALIAVEFKNEPDYASQVVMTTTLLSAFTLTGVIYLSEIIF
ncbi:MAG: AEC family transporter [bacterium]